MKNKSKMIRNKINKFLYCPYQWYYEREYGAQQIRTLYKERNATMKQKDSTKFLILEEEFGVKPKKGRLIYCDAMFW